METFPDFGLQVYCEICQDHHLARYLCDAKNAYIEAARAAAEGNRLPTTIFDEPVYGAIGVEGTNPVLMRQFVAMSGTVEGPAGVLYPALVITGRDEKDRPLPHWIYVGDGADLRRSAKLVDDMVNAAVRTALAENRKRTRSDG